MDSLRLSTDAWDLTLDAGGSLDVVSDPLRIPQDVACYCRTFTGECWYDDKDGIPYLDRELAHLPPAELVTERARRRSLEVPGVASASVSLTDFAERVLRGRIDVTALPEYGGRTYRVEL